MADWYVSKAGDDNNSGADWANAKKTINAAYLAAHVSTDTIYIGAGVFVESVYRGNVTGNHVARFIGGTQGPTVWDGDGLDYCFAQYYSTHQCYMTGIQFRNASKLYRSLGPWAQGLIAENCTFEGYGTTSSFASYATGSGGTLRFTNCILKGCRVYRYHGVHEYFNCTFIDAGIRHNLQSPLLKVTNCLFVSTGPPIDWVELMQTPTAAYPGALAVFQGNHFSVVDATHPIDGYTSLAAFQAATAVETGSAVVSEPVIDAANLNAALPLMSPLLYSGHHATQVGAVTTAMPDTLVAESSTNLTQDSDGFWKLQTPGVGVFRSQVADFGSMKFLRNITAGLQLGNTGQVVDSETGNESAAFRYRASATPFVAAGVNPAWIVHPINVPLNLSSVRYVQVEYTLRTGGDF